MARFGGPLTLRASNIARDAFLMPDADRGSGGTLSLLDEDGSAGAASMALSSMNFDLLPTMPDDFVMRCACASCMEAAAKLEAKNEAAAISREGPQSIPGVAGDNIADDTTTTSTLETQEGQSIQSAIEHIGDQDFFRVGLTAGQKYDFKLEALTQGQTALDGLVQVLDANGTVVAEFDSGSNGATEEFSFTPATGGTYYINVKSYLDSSIGSYRLTGSLNNDPGGTSESPLDSINWGGNSRRVDTDGVVDAQGRQVLHYYFAKPGEAYNSSLGPVAALQWADFAKLGMRQAFDSYETIINVVYVEVATAAAADFVLVANGTAPALLGRMSPPGEEQEGQGEFNTLAESWTAASLTRGGFGHITLIHELGHGHGLAHPHDTGGGSTVMRGVTGDLATGYTNGDFGLNSGVYTTMSYQDGWDGGPNGRSPSDDYGFQGTLMAFDVALLQRKYGANTTYRNGADTYVIRDVNESGTFYSTIWDTGGVDTISYAGARNATIDLRAATLLYEEGGGGRLSYAPGIFGGFTIANGVVIENATGGSGADTLIGNAANNVLTGGSGADTLTGGLGDDRLDGGGGVDTASYADATSAVNVALFLGATSTFAAGTDTYVSIENVIGSAFDDHILGESGANGLSGGAGNDRLEGREGDDVLEGGAGNDAMLGGAGVDTVSYLGAASAVNVALFLGSTGTFGAGFDSYDGVENIIGSVFGDHLLGDTGGNRIQGQAGADQLEGREGVDLLEGEAGNDVLIGGAGGDFLYGGIGADRFVYQLLSDSSGTGVDRVLDFNSAQDLIDLSGIDANVLTGGDQAFVFVSSFSNQAGQARLTYDSVTNRTMLDLDVNGDGISDGSILIDGNVAGSAGFIL